MAWLSLDLCHQHLSCSTPRAGAPLPALPRQLRPAPSGTCCSKHTSVYNVFMDRGPQSAPKEAADLGEGKGHLLTKPLSTRAQPLSACGMEGPLLLCPCCRGRAAPPAGLHVLPEGCGCCIQALLFPGAHSKTKTVFFTWQFLWTSSCVLDLALQGREVQIQSDFCE